MDDCVDCQAKQREIDRLRAWHKERSSYDEHPAEDLSKWRAYDRMPFQTNHNTVVMLTLFKHEGHWNDLWLDDHSDKMRQRYDLYKRAAEQFHKQLEGHDCIAFWKAMKEEAEKEITNWETAKRQRENCAIAESVL